MFVRLGDKVKDRLTDLRGTVWARAKYLYGCVWVCVIPRALHEGKPVETIWLDEVRLEVIPQKKQKISAIGRRDKKERHYEPGPTIPSRRRSKSK